AGLPALYYIDQADNRQTTALGSNMGELIRTLSVLAAGSMALSVLLLCIHFSIRIKDNTHYYAILCCCGRSMKKIAGMAVGELLGLLLLSAAGGYLLAVFLAALLMLEAPEIYLPFLFLLGYGILPLLTALFRLRHLEIARGLREE
ncbi:MAG: FtsX-like permease family protein, partial [Lachnospiraceae bacterium]